MNTIFRNTNMPVDYEVEPAGLLREPDSMTEWVSERVRSAGMRSEGCRVEYVRYKPATSLVVAWSADGETDEDPRVWGGIKAFHKDAFSTAAQKTWALVGQEKPVDGGDCIFVDRRCRAILHRFPHDLSMRGLRNVAHPKKIQRKFHCVLPEYPEDGWRISDSRMKVHAVRYKPEKRSVMRIATRAVCRTSGRREPFEVFARFDSRDGGLPAHRVSCALREALQGNVTVPESLAHDPEWGCTFVRGVAGSPMVEILRGAGTGDVGALCANAGRALAVLHRSGPCEGLPVRTVAAALDDARSTARTLQAILPPAAGQIDDRVESLESMAPSDVAPVFVHGDFSHEQILLDGDNTVILDFDRAHVGDSLEDVGNFCAHIVNAKLGPDADKRGAIDSFLRSYEKESGRLLRDDDVRFWARLGIFMLAVRPFREMDAAWARQIGILLEECGALI